VARLLGLKRGHVWRRVAAPSDPGGCQFCALRRVARDRGSVPPRTDEGRPMIDGFHIDVTADELVRHLDARIRFHHDTAVECDRKRDRLDAGLPLSDDEMEAQVACWVGYRDDLDQQSSRHKRDEQALLFVREHIAMHEIYRLSIPDLRALGIWTTGRRHLATSEV
jgi:hypothetical protein